MPTLQDTILQLSRFWAGEGCLLLPPCDFEVPAGIMHPDAFFRLLGRKPWRAAYLQPIRRPLDGRHGKHPYRLSKHLQFQVLLKAPPDDVPGLYLRSLEELGFELRHHDVRFAEWQWESRSLGARGLGWHVQLDGLGVTRLTYLQQAAGRILEPVSAEISYGIERLAMALAQARNAFHLRWAVDGLDYGRLRQRDEVELSRYASEVADVDYLRRGLGELEKEARRCLEADLLRPTYELAIKGLQAIELLETRGELSAYERDGWLDRMRELVAAAAERYLEERRIERESQAAAPAPESGEPNHGS
ncbi:MAG: glycine--tRNA ligase subunit alpha [bacterium]|nr:glycine--tRNA ligase subunit alpha [bacterium]